MSSTADPSWFENAFIYALDVETFQDSNGDGVGDFAGLTNRLDYLDRLGVDCLWLLPFYDTPNRDNGYDVRDYYSVDDRLGTMEDVREFVDAAHDCDIRVIADLVVNHTSDEHPWFQASRADPDSKYRDYYVWIDDPSEAPPVGSVFPGEVENDRVWTYDEVADAYYFHRFYPYQPGLDLQNPEVREEVDRIVDHWLEFGLDGFRIDAAALMIDQKRPGEPEPVDPHFVLRHLRANAARTNPDVVLLAEADDDPETLVHYFGGHSLPDGHAIEIDGGVAEGSESESEGLAEDGMDLLLNFVLNAHMVGAMAAERSEVLERGFESLPDLTGKGQWANFLRNYDELNLGRLPPADKRVAFDRFAPDEEMRIYGRGIRRRLAPMLDGDQRRLELAFSLLFSMPGTPMVLYGDEIGMGDDLSLPGRQSVRTPMQWSADPNAGFSSADPADLVAPVVDEGPFDFREVNVAAQLGDEGSPLEFVRSLVDVRTSCPAVGSGRCTLLDADDPAAFVHRFDHADGRSVAMVHNLASDPRTVAVDLRSDETRGEGVEGDDDADDGRGGEDARVILGDAGIDVGSDGRLTVDLAGYGFVWLRIDDADSELA